jgi:hypothetical protein
VSATVLFFAFRVYGRILLPRECTEPSSPFDEALCAERISMCMPLLAFLVYFGVSALRLILRTYPFFGCEMEELFEAVENKLV